MNLNLPSNFKLQHAKMLLLISLIAFGGHLSATVYYVSPIGNNGAAGTSWSTAKQSVQNAINLASAGDEVWIRSGTYFPTQDYTGNTAPADNREKTFYIPNGVKVYGGFDGTETQLYQRRNPNYFINPASSYQTILSGDLGTIGNNSDNSYHVVTAAMTTGTGITLDGLIIRDGNANGTGSQIINTLNVARGSGGGIIFISASGTTANWTINNCILLSNNGGTNGGGARFTHGFLKMSNSIFSSNTISGFSSGGGFYYSGSSTAGNGTVTIENSVFVNNTATNAGGGIIVATSPQVTIYNSTFYNNSAPTIGGAIFTSSSATNVSLNNSLFYNNLAVGSATAAAADISIASTTPTINNCFLQLSSGSYTGTLSGCTFGNTNPSFTNTADIDGVDNRYFTNDDGFSLQSSSAAIGAGSNSALGSLNKDIALSTRVMGTVDVGAYEAAGTGKVRWVNNTGATRPTTVTVDAVSQNVYPATYSNVSDAVDESVSGDIVYVTDGTYRNPNRLVSDNCAIAGVLGISGSGGQDLGLYINVSKSNLLITSSTGDFTTSAANLIGYGFNIMPSTNVTIRGFNMDSIRVNAFYNSNGFGYGTTSRVSILKNKIKNTRGHG
ncbi:MAG: hypothetical protein IT244_06475, partial [Bacteroidia bacterium]|nr:hypothetical protein [Bacteroidia bacterium]